MLLQHGALILLGLAHASALLLQPTVRGVTLPFRPRANLHLSLTDEELAALKEATRCLDQVGSEVTKVGGIRTYYAMINDPDIDGPPSAESWAKVRTKFPALAEASDEDLDKALATLPVADYRDLVAEKKAKGTGIFSGKGGDTSALGAGAAPLAVVALCAAAWVGSNVLGGGGDVCPPDATSRACIEKQQRTQSQL